MTANEIKQITELVEQLGSIAALLNDMLSSELVVAGTENVTENWYDQFRSEHTTVEVKSSTVQVTVERGHAPEWKAQLRAAGFRWSKKNRNYWAWIDDNKRAEVAARNIANDAATEGMTPEERRAYWAERRAKRNAA